MNDTEHIHVVDPIYIKHSDLANMSGDLAGQLCHAADRVEPASAVGAQKLRGLWCLFINSDQARVAILDKGLSIQNNLINLFGSNPYESVTISTKTEKIVFKDIPLSDPNGTELIEDYLRQHPHITVTSNVCYSRIKRDNRNTPYRSGERYVYVKADFSPSLPENTQIGHYNTRVWHQSQEVFCKRCNKANMHRTSDVDECENYCKDTGNVLPVREDWDILSNFFMCKVFVFGKIFRSAEHAYQWKKSMDCLRLDLANRILQAYTPKKAKQIASNIDGNALQKWHDVKGHICVMSEVLMAKANSNIDFHAALIRSKGKTIVEATQSLKWGCGLPPSLAVTVKEFPGENLCGKLLMETRYKLFSHHEQASFTPLQPPTQTSVMLCSKLPMCKSSSPPVVKIDIASPENLSTIPTTQTTSPVNNPDRNSNPSASSPPQVINSHRTKEQFTTASRLRHSRSMTFTGSKSRVQSPLVGKIIVNRKTNPPRKYIASYNSDGEPDMECKSVASNLDWPSWDRDSIASEITHIEDCEGLPF